MVNTRRVQDRRRLRFADFASVLADAETLAKAESAGTLRGTGNWHLGQALGHLAYWANAPFDGYPTMPQPPWLLRQLILLFKNRIIFNQMDAGIRMHGVPAGTFGVDHLPTADALARLRRAYERLAAQAPSGLNPLFGELSHEAWISLNLRHAELHLSFFHPQ